MPKSTLPHSKTHHFLKTVIIIALLSAVCGTGLIILSNTTRFLSGAKTSVSDLLPIDCGTAVKLPGCLDPNLKNTFKDDGSGNITTDVSAGSGETNIIQNVIIPGFTTWFIGLIAGICIIIVMIGGLEWITSLGGNTDKANKTIAYGLIGLVVAMLSWAFVMVLNNLPNLMSYEETPVAYALETDTMPQPTKSGIGDILDKLLPQSPVGDSYEQIKNASLEKNVIPYIVDIILRVTGTVAFVAAVYGVGLMITAGTKPDNFSKGFKIISYVIIGMIIISLAYLVVWNIAQIDFGG